MAQITVLLIVICFNFWNNFASADPSLRVMRMTDKGLVEGKKRQLVYGLTCDSFQGIPYAKAPVGSLRFKDPIPPEAWSGVRNATSHGPICPQYGTQWWDFPSEDCLYLNVYSPNINYTHPVMVYIHGGGFKTGSGNEVPYGPDFLIYKGVVLVTFNYRLEALGLLCLDTKEVPGNACMKDQVLALRWVRDNIEQFGGDPNKVTIFGFSAGAASVSYHLVSPMSEGLFYAAIMMSGTFNSDFTNDKNGPERSMALAQRLGCISNHTQERLECLQNLPVDKFVNLDISITPAEYLDTYINIKFGVVKEKPFNTEAFLLIDGKESMEHMANVETIVGYTSEEGIGFITDPNKQIFVANTFPETMVLEHFVRNCPVVVQKEIGKKIRDYHCPGGLVTNDTLAGLMDFYSYFVLKYATEEFFDVRAKMINYKPVYRYCYSSIAEIGYPHPYGLVGVSHGEDQSNLFYSSYLQVLFESSRQKIETATTLWTNFAKYRNPTPDNNTLGFLWLPYTPVEKYYLDIGAQVKLRQNLDLEKLTFWKNIYRAYKNKCCGHIFCRC